MNKQIEYFVTMIAELKADCYCGESFEEIEPEWHISCEGDKDLSVDNQPIHLDIKNFPYGTKITVAVPCCPECGEMSDCWLDKESKWIGKCDCGFDWESWIKNEYS